MKGEDRIIQLILQRLSASPVIIDVGAFDGYHLLQFHAKTGGRGRYVAIEAIRPRPKVWPDGVTWVFAIASDIEGEADWHASDMGHPGSGSTVPPVSHIGKIYAGLTFEPPSKRKAIRIDALCKRLDIDHIDLLWLDVQGAELPVLRGCGDMLNRTHLIAVEVHAGEYVGAPTQHEIVDAIGPGFDCITPLSEGHLLLQRKQ